MWVKRNQAAAALPAAPAEASAQRTRNNPNPFREPAFEGIVMLKCSLKCPNALRKPDIRREVISNFGWRL
ncbi:unnamed protein product, partial [Iphiclides podalirius]